MFGNHYVRDSLGALEKQLESDTIVSVNYYMILNILYFLPNIITPLVVGLLMEKLGGVNSCFFYSVCIASLGHLLFAGWIVIII